MSVPSAAGKKPKPLKGKAAELVRIHGETIQASIGVRKPGAPEAAAPRRAVGLPRDRGVQAAPSFRLIALDRLIADPGQPRKKFEPRQIARLAASLKARGQLHPARVYYDEGADRYVIIAGESRLRAAQEAALEGLVCQVLPGRPTESQIRAEQLVENLVRAGLKPLEQAAGLKALARIHRWGPRQIAAETGLSPATVSRSLALLRLPASTRALLRKKQLSGAAAYEISKLPDRVAREALARRAAAEKLTRDQIRAEVRTCLAAKQGAPDASGDGDATNNLPKVSNLDAGQATADVSVPADSSHTADSSPIATRGADQDCFAAKQADPDASATDAPATLYVDPPAEAVAWASASGGLPTTVPEAAGRAPEEPLLRIGPNAYATPSAREHRRDSQGPAPETGGGGGCVTTTEPSATTATPPAPLLDDRPRPLVAWQTGPCRDEPGRRSLTVTFPEELDASEALRVVLDDLLAELRAAERQTGGPPS